MSAWTAAAAASLSSGGHGKSGKPCARLTAPAATARRFISRMTDSVNRSARAEIRGMAGSLMRVSRGAPASMVSMHDREPASRWRRNSRRAAYENPWLTVWHDEVTRPDGAPGIYGVVHFANLAVGVVAIDADDRVALVGQHRYTLDAYSWEIPEGGVPPDEDPRDGAARELREETGVVATEWRELGR